MARTFFPPPLGGSTRRPATERSPCPKTASPAAGLGRSGSGKSTFLRCINHLEQIGGGRLWVDGELVGYRQQGDKLYELREREVARKRSEIGMVFQRFNLFPHMTALGNIMEGPVQV